MLVALALALANVLAETIVKVLICALAKLSQQSYQTTFWVESICAYVPLSQVDFIGMLENGSMS